MSNYINEVTSIIESCSEDLTQELIEKYMTSIDEADGLLTVYDELVNGRFISEKFTEHLNSVSTRAYLRSAHMVNPYSGEQEYRDCTYPHFSVIFKFRLRSGSIKLIKLYYEMDWINGDNGVMIDAPDIECILEHYEELPYTGEIEVPNLKALVCPADDCDCCDEY